MVELARRSALSKQTMTELVRRLERDELVERRPDPADGRASLIFLTERSRAFQPVAVEILADLDGRVRQTLDVGRAEQLRAALR
jgi:DNA-binding MarR family transcriptional regulator